MAARSFEFLPAGLPVDLTASPSVPAGAEPTTLCPGAAERTTGRTSAGRTQAVRRRNDPSLELLARKSGFTATVAAAERAQRTRPLLHPEMGRLYREWVIDARDGLRDPDRRTDAMTALRAMVEEMVLTPEQGKLGLVLKGDLAAMLAAASPRSDSADLQRQVKVVAGACNRRYLQLWSGAA
jgi:hypothetical protein